MDEKDLAQRFGVTGFPTLKYFPAGDEAEVEAYNEGRDLDSFVKFLNKKVSRVFVYVLQELNGVLRAPPASYAASFSVAIPDGSTRRWRDANKRTKHTRRGHSSRLIPCSFYELALSPAKQTTKGACLFNTHLHPTPERG